MKTRRMNRETEVVTLDDSSDSYDTVVLDDSSDDDNIVTESNARCSNTKAIDTEPITLDDKSQKEDSVIQNDSLDSGDRLLPDVSFEDYDYNLKLMRYGNFEQYKTTWRTKLKVALKDLIDELAKSGKSLVLTRRGGTDTLSLDGTPHSLDLDSGTVLNAIVIYEHQQQQQSTTSTTASSTKSVRDPNIITLKLQDGQRKHLKEFQINKHEPLEILKVKYSKEFNIDLNRMKLSFDGDTVDDQDTPDSLDIEDECVIDVIVSG